MQSKEMILFKKALWEASCNVYERELAACTENAKCSRRHYAKMRKILGVAVLPATNRPMMIRRRVVAALIAAVLLLTGCTAYAYRAEIRDFFETIFDDHVEVKYKEGEEPATHATIDQYYTLGYVPEGYELVNSFEGTSKVKCDWSNPRGDYIVFEQYHVDSTLFVMDNNFDNWETIQIGNHDINYRFSGTHCYFWNDGIYAYQITTSLQWSEQELNYMIENLQVKE